MPSYGYRDNDYLWGGLAGDVGGSLNNAIVGLHRLRYQQAMQAQQQAMDRAYLDLAVRKFGEERSEFAAEGPIREAQAKAETSRGKLYDIQRQVQEQVMAQDKELGSIANLVGDAMSAKSRLESVPGIRAGQPGIPEPMSGPSQFGITPELASAIGPGSYDPRQLLGILGGLINKGTAQAQLLGVTQAGPGIQSILAGPAQYLSTPARGAIETPAQQVDRLGVGLGSILRGTSGRTNELTGGITRLLMDVVNRARAGTNAPDLSGFAQPSTGPSRGAMLSRPQIRPGDVYKGYRFKGGDPSKPENWEEVAPEPQQPDTQVDDLNLPR